PQILETSNLPKAFNRFAAQMSASIDTQIICNIIGEIYPLSVDIENNLLRIGQEALTNAIKYASASKIKIELVYEPTQFILRYCQIMHWPYLPYLRGRQQLHPRIQPSHHPVKSPDRKLPYYQIWDKISQPQIPKLML
ncbi:hypothetical protein H1Q63_11335, partial [Desmonostoc muscorum CCALA 125]|nr:hypothetical protein [Desmonostoc muscorum CCALA 125]